MVPQNIKDAARRGGGVISVTITNPGGTQVLGRSNSRVCITFSPTASGAYHVGPTPDVSAGKGLLVAQGTENVHLRIEDYGDLVRGPWWALPDGAGTYAIGLIEVVLPEL